MTATARRLITHGSQEKGLPGGEAPGSWEAEAVGHQDLRRVFCGRKGQAGEQLRVGQCENVKVLSHRGCPELSGPGSGPVRHGGE